MTNSSRIEPLIDEIRSYIANCKLQAFSNSKIIVDKNMIEDLLEELRRKTPDEIARCQKIISNREAILSEARSKAENLINAATIQTNELVSEHEIMQKAYAEANEVISLATMQAQEILDNATREANAVRASAVEYTDELLKNVEDIMAHTSMVCTDKFNEFKLTVDNCNQIVKENRLELYPVSELEGSDNNSEINII